MAWCGHVPQERSVLERVMIVLEFWDHIGEHVVSEESSCSMVERCAMEGLSCMSTATVVYDCSSDQDFGDP